MAAKVKEEEEEEKTTSVRSSGLERYWYDTLDGFSAEPQELKEAIFLFLVGTFTFSTADGVEGEEMSRHLSSFMSFTFTMFRSLEHFTCYNRENKWDTTCTYHMELIGKTQCMKYSLDLAFMQFVIQQTISIKVIREKYVGSCKVLYAEYVKTKENRCAACTTASDTLLCCSKCTVFRYCDRDCQRAHWKQHKVTCSSWAKPLTMPRVDDNLLSMKWRGEDEDKPTIEDAIVHLFIQLKPVFLYQVL